MENLFYTLLEISLTTGLIALILTLISPLLGKAYAAKWKYWVWLILAVRLLVPVSFSLPQAPVELQMPQTVFTSTQFTQNNDEVPPFIDGGAQTGDAAQTDAETTTGTENPITLSLAEIAMLIWLAGFLYFIIHQTIAYNLFKKHLLRWSSPPAETRISDMMNSILTDMNIKRSVTLIVSEKASSPMMTGLLKPCLFLPHEDYNDTELRYILTHELTHLKRRDIWFKLLLIAANAVHWFNPLIYLLQSEAAKDLELSCDDEVMCGKSYDERKEYSETILATIRRQKPYRTALSTYFFGGTKVIKKRFQNIFNMNKKRRGAVALILVLIVTVMAGMLVACEQKRNEETTPSPSETTSPSETPETVGMPSSEYALIWNENGEDQYLELGYQEGTFPWNREIVYHDQSTSTSGDMPGMEFHTLLGSEVSLFYTYIEETDREALRTLQTISPSYETPRGISVGDTAEDILAAYDSDLLYEPVVNIVHSDISTDFCTYNELYIYTREEDFNYYIAFYIEVFGGEQIIRGIEMSVGWEGPTYTADEVNIFTVYAEEPDPISEPYIKIHDLFSESDGSAESVKEIITALSGMNWSEYYHAYGDEAFDILDWLYQQEITEDEDILSVLKAANGLDGAFAEGYASIVAEIYLNDHMQFITQAGLLDSDGIDTVTAHAVYGLGYDDNFDDYLTELEELQNRSGLTAGEADVIKKMLYFMENTVR